MNNERFKELTKFKEEFNAKLRNALEQYESKLTLRNILSKDNTKNFKTINKSRSTKLIKENLKFQNTITLPQKTITNLKPKRVNSYIINKNKAWKPQHMVGDVFDKNFKRLKDFYEMSNWDKYRIDLAERSYEKEKNTLTGHNLVCRNLYGKEIDNYPNIEKTIPESTKGLTRNGKKIISRFIEKNKSNENILRRKKTCLFNYMHSKPPLILNDWKASNHVKDCFSVLPLDKIYSFRVNTGPKPTYMTKPFRRPKDYGDYFDKHIGYVYN